MKGMSSRTWQESAVGLVEKGASVSLGYDAKDI